MSRSVVLVDAVRSPFGKAGSLYAEVRADDIMVRVLRGLIERNPKVTLSEIDDVAIAAALPCLPDFPIPCPDIPSTDGVRVR